MKLYEIVRITYAYVRPQADPWSINRREPHPGDTGAIVEIIHTTDGGCVYVVESIDETGQTRWLEEFSAGEIETVQ